MDDDILLSWISEYVYCRRRFYLRYVECMQTVSRDMIEGRYQHRIVDDKHITRRGPHVIVSRLYVSSNTYAIRGFCDNVEFDEDRENGVFIPFLRGPYQVHPAEFKHGKVRQESEYEQQLCAQALCLEEMYRTRIESGILYYVDSRERVPITFSESLRDETTATVSNMILDLKQLEDGAPAGTLFPPKYLRRCNRCAMYDICSPRNMAIDRYMKQLWSLGVSEDD